LSGKITVTKQDVNYFGIPHDWILKYKSPMPGWVDIQDTDIYYGIPGFLDRGFKVAHDKRGIEFDPTKDDRTPDDKEISFAKKYLAKRFPGLAGAPLLESRVCQYSNTETGNLIIDNHPEAVNVLFLGGDSGHGFKYGPAIGDYVSKLLVGEANLRELFKL
jgi:glycine/D-amino acid oxidase-like deaminating enzyme